MATASFLRLGAFRLALAALVALALSFVASSARAQDASSKAAAEALFTSGVELMKSGRFAEACPKLETSQRVDPGVGTLLYLAECYEKLGRTASAWATFREAESLARASHQADRTRTAQARAERLEPELGYLTVNVPASARVEGLVVRRGGLVVVADLYGVASPVDPGLVEIEATAPQYRRYTTQVRVSARGKEAVAIPKLEAAPGETPPPVAPVETPPGSVPPTSDTPPAEAPPPSDQPPPSGPDHTVAYIFGGVGIVGIGLGSYFGLRAFSKNSDAEKSCNASNVCTDPNSTKQTQDARDAAMVSNVAFAFGGAALATGIILFVLAPSGDEAHALRIAPSVAANGGGLSVAGSFQ